MNIKTAPHRYWHFHATGSIRSLYYQDIIPPHPSFPSIRFWVNKRLFVYKIPHLISLKSKVMLLWFIFPQLINSYSGLNYI